MNRFLPKTSRGSRTSLLIAMAFALAAPASVVQGPAHAATGDLTDAEINHSLDFLAKRLAAETDRADLRTSIHEAVAKRFDGDENALWSSLAVDPAFSASIAGDSKSSDASARAATMPRLQIAVPANFDSWDPATFAPLVGYLPQGVEDTELATITAYDAAGNAVALDAQVAPTQPVIVLGLNERTDQEGKLLERSATPPDQTTTTGSTATTIAAAATYSVDMRVVELKSDSEPWTAGDAEISLRAKSRGCSGTEYLDPNWSSLNNTGDIWAPGGTRNLGLTTCDVVFYWWEDDGGGPTSP